MAEVLDDGEFWLPPQFLADDDLFMDKSRVNNNLKSLLPSGYESFRFTSDLSSPVESVVGSTETESDEEYYLVGLTRLMARYTLEEDFGGNDRPSASENSKDWVLSSSPESTLCGSHRGSSNCQSRVSSPPGTWVLLYSAAEEATRAPMNEESYGGFNNKGLLGPPPKKPSPNLDPSGVYPHQSLSLRTTQFQQVKQSQLMKQHNAQVRGSKNDRPLGYFPSAWHPLQQQSQRQNGSGLRAVFLGNPTGKRECAGTGVFLPRRIGAAQPRKKQDRVVQALNLNLDEINAQPKLHPRFINASVSTDSGAGSRLRSGGNGFANLKQRKFRPQQGISPETRLPQEWTY